MNLLRQPGPSHLEDFFSRVLFVFIHCLILKLSLSQEGSSGWLQLRRFSCWDLWDRRSDKKTRCSFWEEFMRITRLQILIFHTGPRGWGMDLCCSTPGLGGSQFSLPVLSHGWRSLEVSTTFFLIPPRTQQRECLILASPLKGHVSLGRGYSQETEAIKAPQVGAFSCLFHSCLQTGGRSSISGVSAGGKVRAAKSRVSPKAISPVAWSWLCFSATERDSLGFQPPPPLFWSTWWMFQYPSNKHSSLTGCVFLTKSSNHPH